jgi:hypothetical protein
MQDKSPPEAGVADRSRPALRTLRRWAPRAVFESVLIIFSVCLALGLSQWAEDRRTAERVDDIRGFLAREMRENRALLVSDDYLPHHNRLKRDFSAAAGRQSDPVDPEATRIAMQNMLASGYHPPQMKNAVWTSVSSGELIEHMPPEDVFLLAEVYRGQQTLEQWSDQGADTAVGLLDILQRPEEAKNRLIRMVVFLEDMTAQERRLIELYDRAIAQMDPEAADASTSPDDAAAAKR